MAEAVRQLIDPPLPGHVNMARDEALLTTLQPGSPPILRFYAWSAPTISLGYFQTIEEFEAQDAAIRKLDVVRRTTGGGAILHDLELTYSIVIPWSHPLVAGKGNDLYRIAHRAIIAAVRHGVRIAGSGADGACGESSQRGPFFCFARRHALDVIVPDAAAASGHKLAGSAQRRSQVAILQHGSIILDSRFPQQPCATWRGTAGSIDFAGAAEAIGVALKHELGATLEIGEWTALEREAAHRLEAKYAGAPWTRERQSVA